MPPPYIFVTIYQPHSHSLFVTTHSPLTLPFYLRDRQHYLCRDPDSSDWLPGRASPASPTSGVPQTQAEASARPTGPQEGETRQEQGSRHPTAAIHGHPALLPARQDSPGAGQNQQHQ